MKITKNQLKQIIKEELAQVLAENVPSGQDPRGLTDEEEAYRSQLPYPERIRINKDDIIKGMSVSLDVDPDTEGIQEPSALIAARAARESGTDARTMEGGVEVYGSGQAARNNPALKR